MIKTMQKRINELKAENDRLKDEFKRLKESECKICKYFNIGDKYKQTLQKIKAIAEDNINCKQYEIDHDCFNDIRCKALRELIETLQQILDLIKAEEE